jgi:hypothetical protein
MRLTHRRNIHLQNGKEKAGDCSPAYCYLIKCINQLIIILMLQVLQVLMKRLTLSKKALH